MNIETQIDTALNELYDMQEGNEVKRQTEMTRREMEGIMKAMISVKEELTNELAKLSKIGQEIVKEKEKLTQTDDNEIIQNRIRDLESEKKVLDFRLLI